MTIWAIVPVKPMRRGKSRLAGILTEDERADLTAELLRHTLEVLNNVPEIECALVASRDPAALKIGQALGAVTFAEGEKQDLNLALARTAHVAAAQGAKGILILPVDLPFLDEEAVTAMIDAVLPDEAGQFGNGRHYTPHAMAICTDCQGNGTNALLIFPPTGFTFHYGPGSFERHVEEAGRLGMTYQIVENDKLHFDIDTEADWRHYQAQLAASEV